MNPNLIALVETILLLTLLVLALLILTAFVLSRFWKRKIQDELKPISAQLRRLGSEGKSLNAAVSNFSDNPPLPFNPLVAKLRSRLEKSEAAVQGLSQQYGNCQQAFRDTTQRDWKSISSSPIQLYRLLRQVTDLREKLKLENNSLQDTRLVLDEIEDQGWVLAGKIKQMKARLAATDQILTQLQKRDLHGELLTQAFQTRNQILSELNNIPIYFFTEPRESILAQATRDEIVAGYQIASITQPLVDELDSLATEWDEQYNAAIVGRNSLKETVTALQDFLSDRPAGLILSEVEAQFDRISVMITQTDDNFLRHEIGNLAAVNQEISDIFEVVNATRESLSLIKRHRASLSDIILEIQPAHAALMAAMAQLSERPSYPLNWNKSQVQLNDLSQRIAALGGIEKPRTPALLEKDLTMAKTLQSRVKELENQFHTTAKIYDEIIQVIKSLDFHGTLVKSQKSNRIAAQLAEYNSDNWPRQDGIDDFKADLEVFLNGLKTVVPESATISLKETELPQLFNQVKKVTQQARALQNREDRINNRLVQLQTMESEAQESLGLARAVLNQISLLANANPALRESQGGEIDRLLVNIDQMITELNYHSQGLVEKKIQKVNDLLNKTEQSSNNWLDKLIVDVRVKKEIISEKISHLKSITDLSEPAIADARQILETSQPDGDESVLSFTRNRIPLSDIFVHYKTTNETWQHCISLARAIDEIEGPVLDAFDKVEQKREDAREQLSQVSRWMSSTKKWPPSSVNLEAQQREYEDIEQMRASTLKGQPRAIWLVGRLGDLAARYQDLASGTRRAGERAEAEQKRLKDLEQQLEEAARLWQRQKTAYISNTVATANIQRLLNDINTEMQAIKRQVKPGGWNFDQIENNLSLLTQNALSTRIPIEDGQKDRHKR